MVLLRNLYYEIQNTCFIVCRRWDAIADCWYGVRKIIFKDPQHDDKEVTVNGSTIIIKSARGNRCLNGVLARCGQVLRSLVNERKNQSAVCAATKQCPQLEEVHIKCIESQRQDRQLSETLSQIQNLKRLTLNLQYRGESFCMASVNGRVLTHVDIYATRPTSLLPAMKILIEAFEKIEKFSSNILDNEALKLISGKSTLKFLEIMQAQDSAISESGLRTIVNLKDLQHLKINCKHTLWGGLRLDISEAFIRALVQGCSKLEGINFDGKRETKIFLKLFLTIQSIKN